MSDKQIKVVITADGKKANSNMKGFSGELGKLSRVSEKASSKVDKLGKAVDQVGNEVKKAKTKTDGLSTSNEKLGKSYNITSTAITAFKRGLVIASGGIIASLKAFSNYEEALISVAKTANLGKEEAKKFGKEFKDATKDIPVSTNEMLEFAASGARVGVVEKNLTKFATTMARLKASTEGLDLQGAAMSIASTVLLTEGGTDNVDRFASAVAMLGDTFPTTEQKILHSSNRISGVLARFNVSAAQVAGLAAATATVKIEAEAAGSSLGRVFTELESAIFEGGETLEMLMILTGKSQKELDKAFRKDAVGVFQDFTKALNKVPQEQFNKTLEVFGLNAAEDRRLVGLLATKGLPILTRALATANEEYARNEKLVRESKIAFSTFGSKMVLVWKRVTDFAVVLGGKLAPAFTELANEAIAFFDALQNSTAIDTLANGILGVMKVGRQLTVFFVELLKDISNTLINSGFVSAFNELFGKAFKQSMEAIKGFVNLFSVAIRDIANILNTTGLGKALKETFLVALELTSNAMNSILKLAQLMYLGLRTALQAIGVEFGKSEIIENLKLFRKLLEMDLLLDTLALMFAKTAVKISNTFSKLGLIFDFKKFGIIEFVSDFQNTLSKLAVIAEVAFSNVKQAIKIKGLEIGREAKILAEQATTFEIFGGRSNEEVRAGIEQEYDVRIKAIKDETLKLNKAIFEEGQKTVNDRDAELKSQSDELLQKYNDIKTSEANVLANIDRQIYENAKAAKEELAKEQAEEEGAKSPTDALTGNPEETQQKVDENGQIIVDGHKAMLEGITASEAEANEAKKELEAEGGSVNPLDVLLGTPDKTKEKVDENKAVIEEGTNSLLDNIKQFFGVSAKENKKDTKGKEEKAVAERNIATETSSFLLANQELFGEKSVKIAQGLALANTLITQGEAIGKAIKAASSVPPPATAAAIASSVGAVLSAMAPAIATIKGVRQEGGDVTAGEAYLVGERGAEKFIPDQDGVIVPNNSLQQNVNIVVTAGDDFAQRLFFDIQDQQELDMLPN